MIFQTIYDSQCRLHSRLVNQMKLYHTIHLLKNRTIYQELFKMNHPIVPRSCAKYLLYSGILLNILRTYTCIMILVNHLQISKKQKKISKGNILCTTDMHIGKRIPIPIQCRYSQVTRKGSNKEHINIIILFYR